MNEELANLTLGYLIGYYKTHEETIIDKDEVDAINFIIEKNQELKKQLEELELIVTLSKKRNLISKFDKEYDKEDKKKNPNKNHAEIIPDAEEVYRRYYTMKNQQKEFIEWLEENWKTTQDIWYIKILNKYRSIIGCDKSE